MKQILPHLLWLGHAREVGDGRPLFDAGVKAVVELAMEEPPSQPPRELTYCRFPLLDGVSNDPDLLALAIRTVAALLKHHVPTLVCCSTGLSRAPAIAAAAIALAENEKPETCLERVVAHYPSDVSPGFWNEVRLSLASLRG